MGPRRFDTMPRGWAAKAFAFGLLSIAALCLARTSTLASTLVSRVPVIYAAAAPYVDALSPAGGLPGTTITITGRNLDGVSEVFLEDSIVVGSAMQPQIRTFPCTFTIASATRLTAIIPQTSIGSGKLVAVIVVNGTGSTNAGGFDYAQPTSVPNVLGMSLASARSALTQARLVVGTVHGSTSTTAVVSTQIPAAGSTVAMNSLVNLDMTAPSTGQCLVLCPAGATCINGVCVCPTGLLACGNACCFINGCLSDAAGNETCCAKGICADPFSLWCCP